MIGGPVGWALSHNPVIVGSFTFLFSWGLISFLMWWPERRYVRNKYLNFVLGDSPIGLPLMFTGMAGMLREYDGTDRFWGHSLWQTLVFAVAGIIVVGMFIVERVTHQYTLEEQLTPSKIAHNVVLFVGLSIAVTAFLPAASTLDTSVGIYDVCFLVGTTVWLGAFIHDTFFGEHLEGAHMTKKMWERHLAANRR